MNIKLPRQLLFDEFRQRFFELPASEDLSLVNGQTSLKKKEYSLNEKIDIVVKGQSGEHPIEEICQDYGITVDTFHAWSKSLLQEPQNTPVEEVKPDYSQDDKFRIVLEGLNGEYSVAEIIRREDISHEEFLQWSNDFLQIRNKRLLREKARDEHTFKTRRIVVDKAGEEVLAYLESFVDVTGRKTLVCQDNSCIKELTEWNNNFVSLAKINDVRHVNKHFELINEKLPMHGLYIGCLETFTARRMRKSINKIPVINDLYFGAEFFFNRILPKLNSTKALYFNFTKGKGRLMSKAEGLGRLVSCGFSIIDVKSINGLTYFVVKKVGDPVFDLSPSYGPLYRMPRLGKNGKIIKVYKLRTMHPYSEYLQDYMVRANGYAESGKPAGDFRIPKWGKFMRRFWIDEVPQLINVLKGDMKLVGIRPVSKRYFIDIPKEMQKLRLTQKPGCIPPYVSLNRDGNVMSVLQAEKDYLEEKIRNPYFTDTKYFFKAIYNIVFKHKRSA